MTTNRQHAIIQKKIINHDRGGTYVMCAWDDCERVGYQLYKASVDYGKTTPQVVTHVFCSERHRQYWINSAGKNGDVTYGQLPAGYKRSF